MKYVDGSVFNVVPLKDNIDINNNESRPTTL